MLFSLDVVTWLTFAGWMLFGLVLYFAYGMRRSKLARS
ncbi:amino acid permease C-terminal domain-containing protein [Amycolatopsis albispora]